MSFIDECLLKQDILWDAEQTSSTFRKPWYTVGKSQVLVMNTMLLVKELFKISESSLKCFYLHVSAFFLCQNTCHDRGPWKRKSAAGQPIRAQAWLEMNSRWCHPETQDEPTPPEGDKID